MSEAMPLSALRRRHRQLDPAPVSEHRQLAAASISGRHLHGTVAAALTRACRAAKRPRQWLIPTIVAAATVSLVSGCTTLIDGSAVRAAGEPAGVDLALLDVGNYPTKPVPPLGKAATRAYGAILEGQRLANYVVGPWEVDPSLITGSIMGEMVLKNGSAAKMMLTPEMAEVPSLDSVVTGFVANREGTAKADLSNMVLVFANPEIASTAAKQFSDAAAAGDNGSRSTQTVPGHPDAVAVGQAVETPGQPALWRARAVTPRGATVLIQRAVSPGGMEAAMALVTKTLDLQVPLIDKFTPTGEDQLAELPIDPTGLLARTLPLDRKKASVNQLSVYEPRGALHLANDPTASGALFDQAGVTRQAVAGTDVTETRDAAAAEQLVQGLAKLITARGGTPAAPVKQISDSQCLKVQQMNTTGFFCLLAAGRYTVAAVASQLLDAQQKAAAQYAMLMAS